MQSGIYRSEKKRLKPKLQHLRKVKKSVVWLTQMIPFLLYHFLRKYLTHDQTSGGRKSMSPTVPQWLWHLVSISRRQITSLLRTTGANHPNTCRSIFRISNLKCFQQKGVWPDQSARRRRSYRWCFGCDGNRKLLLACKWKQDWRLFSSPDWLQPEFSPGNFGPPHGGAALHVGFLADKKKSWALRFPRQMSVINPADLGNFIPSGMSGYHYKLE